jgi:hypothetical protein
MSVNNTLRENVIIENIPYSWLTNLSNEEIVEFYSVLNDDLDFIIRDKNHQNLNLFVKEIQFKDGMGFCAAYYHVIAVAYHTIEDWNRIDAHKNELEELRAEQEDKLSSEALIFQTQNDLMLKAINDCLDTKNNKDIILLIDGLNRLRQNSCDVHIKMFNKWRFEPIDFNKLLDEDIVDPAIYILDNSINFDEYCILPLDYFMLRRPTSIKKWNQLEIIIESGINKFKDTESDLETKRICFWEAVGKYEYSLKYLELQIESTIDSKDKSELLSKRDKLVTMLKEYRYKY